jgi:pimeloyl-ACP methyl ester carboxylesterase
MFLRVGDLTLHLRIDGPAGAPALLLLHSLGTSQMIFDAQAEGLKTAFRVIRPDLRGHGLTTVTPGPYDIAQLARDMLGVLDGLGVTSAHVAGISIGGLVAQSIAHQAPERVRSLILIDTALAIPPPDAWRERAARVRAEGIAPLMDGVIARWVTPAFMDAPETEGLRAVLRPKPSPPPISPWRAAPSACQRWSWWATATRRRRFRAPRRCGTRSPVRN